MLSTCNSGCLNLVSCSRRREARGPSPRGPVRAGVGARHSLRRRLVHSTPTARRWGERRRESTAARSTSDALDAVQVFQPQLDPLPAIAFTVVFAAFVAVQTTVRRAMDARERREDVEAALKKGRLRQLQGRATVEEVRQLEQRLEEAFDEEQAAAEFFVSEGLRIRVRVPRPIGTPLENVSAGEEEEGDSRGRSEERRKIEKKETAGQRGSSRLLNELAFDSKTALVVAVSLVLIWSLLGLSSDPMAPAPEWLEQMGSKM